MVLGGYLCLLFGDFGQLPPVMDLPLYITVPRSALSDLGSAAYQNFDHAIILDQIIHQRGLSIQALVLQRLHQMMQVD